METNPTTEILKTPVPNKKNKYQNLDAYLNDCSVSLTNASDEEVAPLLAARGYTAAIITAKIAEHATAKQLITTQIKEYGDQYQATQNYNLAADALHPKYIEHIEIARIAFKTDIAAKTTLAINGQRKRSASGYCNQALLFYKGALENTNYAAALAAKGVTNAELTAGKTGYTNLLDLEAKQAKETGEAQAATAKRDKAVDDFADWFSEFKAMGKIALNSKPQLREKLGWKQ